MKIPEKKRTENDHAPIGSVFQLPSQDGGNKALGKWIKSSCVEKHSKSKRSERLTALLSTT
jgi:hypothetical protein